MLRIPLERSASVSQACGRFLDDLQAWAEACMDACQSRPPIDSHDQLTYTTSWGPLIRRRGHQRTLSFLKARRDLVRDHFTGGGAWHHGYWTGQDVHHGTEHFELFLGFLHELDPSDRQTTRQLADAAEHFANLVQDVPAFFDWDLGLFRSTHLATREVLTDAHHAINVPDHFRAINLARIAHRVTGDERYLTLAHAHAQRWAEAIERSESLPLALRGNTVITSFRQVSRERITQVGKASAVGQRQKNSPVHRAENFLASNALEALLALGERAAAEKLIEIVAGELTDAEAHVAAAAVRDYRRFTGDARLDKAVMNAAAQWADTEIREVAMEAGPARDKAPAGLGKRSDMPNWYVDGAAFPASPVLLELAAEITGREAWAVLALDLARARFNLARQACPSGRDHGCSARSVSAVARGHGRDNNAGMVTQVLEPVLAHFQAHA